MTEEIIILEQESKELKETITSLEGEIRQKKMTIMMNNDHYLTVDENNRKYRSALEEIKKNLKEICKEECDYTKPKFCGDCDCRYGQILTKINEVLK